MAQNVNPTFVKTPNNGISLISSGSGAAQVTIYTGGVNGSKIVGMIATCHSGNNATVDVQWGIANPVSGFIPLGTFSAVIAAGYLSSVPAINVMSPVTTPGLPIDSDGNPYIFLKSTADTLVIKQAGATITAGQVNVTAFSGDF